jgi:hypothetical protein
MSLCPIRQSKQSSERRFFHPLNSLGVSTNLWLSLLCKIDFFLFSQTYIKNCLKFIDSKSVFSFSLALVIVEFLAIL